MLATLARSRIIAVHDRCFSQLLRRGCTPVVLITRGFMASMMAPPGLCESATVSRERRRVSLACRELSTIMIEQIRNELHEVLRGFGEDLILEVKALLSKRQVDVVTHCDNLDAVQFSPSGCLSTPEKLDRPPGLDIEIFGSDDESEPSGVGRLGVATTSTAALPVDPMCHVAPGTGLQEDATQNDFATHTSCDFAQEDDLAIQEEACLETCQVDSEDLDAVQLSPGHKFLDMTFEQFKGALSAGLAHP